MGAPCTLRRRQLWPSLQTVDILLTTLIDVSLAALPESSNYLNMDSSKIRHEGATAIGSNRGIAATIHTKSHRMSLGRMPMRSRQALVSCTCCAFSPSKFPPRSCVKGASTTCYKFRHSQRLPNAGAAAGAWPDRCLFVLVTSGLRHAYCAAIVLSASTAAVRPPEMLREFRFAQEKRKEKWQSCQESQPCRCSHTSRPGLCCSGRTSPRTIRRSSGIIKRLKGGRANLHPPLRILGPPSHPLLCLAFFVTFFFPHSASSSRPFKHHFRAALTLVDHELLFFIPFRFRRTTLVDRLSHLIMELRRESCQLVSP